MMRLDWSTGTRAVFDFIAGETVYDPEWGASTRLGVSAGTIAKRTGLTAKWVGESLARLVEARALVQHEPERPRAGQRRTGRRPLSYSVNGAFDEWRVRWGVDRGKALAELRLMLFARSLGRALPGFIALPFDTALDPDGTLNSAPYKLIRGGFVPSPLTAHYGGVVPCAAPRSSPGPIRSSLSSSNSSSLEPVEPPRPEPAIQEEEPAQAPLGEGAAAVVAAFDRGLGRESFGPPRDELVRLAEGKGAAEVEHVVAELRRLRSFPVAWRQAHARACILLREGPGTPLDGPAMADPMARPPVAAFRAPPEPTPAEREAQRQANLAEIAALKMRRMAADPAPDMAMAEAAAGQNGAESNGGPG
jgi:hypothetical protein